MSDSKYRLEVLADRVVITIPYDAKKLSEIRKMLTYADWYQSHLDRGVRSASYEFRDWLEECSEPKTRETLAGEILDSAFNACGRRGESRFGNGAEETAESLEERICALIQSHVDSPNAKLGALAFRDAAESALKLHVWVARDRVRAAMLAWDVPESTA